VVLAPVTVGTRRRAAALAGGIALALGLLACGQDPTRTERFCDRLREDQTVLASLPPTPGGLDQVVAVYREVGEVAPLAIEEDWTVISTLISAAAAVDASDPAAVDQVRADALAATQSIERVTSFAAETCGVTLGALLVGTTPVTLPDGATVPPTSAAAGTLPPSSG
jgi:hypothetical protein